MWYFSWSSSLDKYFFICTPSNTLNSLDILIDTEKKYSSSNVASNLYSNQSITNLSHRSERIHRIFVFFLFISYFDFVLLFFSLSFGVCWYFAGPFSLVHFFWWIFYISMEFFQFFYPPPFFVFLSLMHSCNCIYISLTPCSFIILYSYQFLHFSLHSPNQQQQQQLKKMPLPTTTNFHFNLNKIFKLFHSKCIGNTLGLSSHGNLRSS